MKHNRQADRCRDTASSDKGKLKELAVGKTFRICSATHYGLNNQLATLEGWEDARHVWRVRVNNNVLEISPDELENIQDLAIGTLVRINMPVSDYHGMTGVVEGYYAN